MSQNIQMDVTRAEILETAKDIMRDQLSKAEIVETILSAAFEEWNARGAREGCKAYITEIVAEAAQICDPPLTPITIKKPRVGKLLPLNPN